MAVIGLILVGSIFLVQNVHARAFKEEQFASKFDLYIKNDKTHLRKNFKKITDEEDHPFYDVSPTRTSYFKRDDYELKLSSLDKETLEQISKIMYFGYGYENRKSNAYYFATQYLIYQTFSTVDTTVELNDMDVDYMEEEIRKIEESEKSVTFSLKDFTADKTVYEIVDSYIVDNFTVEGKDISVSYEKGKIVIIFLHELESYELRFVPKNECKDTQVWSTLNMELLERGTVCEQEYQVHVKLEKKKQEESNEKTEDKIEDTENTEIENKKEEIENPEVTDKIEEKEEAKQPNEEVSKEAEQEIPIPIEDGDFSMLEVNVPNTKKNRSFLIEILCLLGSCYYVFKK